MKNYPIVLSIAGSDSTCQGGVQSDIKTISGLSAYATTVTTSIAVQKATGIEAIHVIPPEIVKNQIEFVMENMWPDVVKIGLVSDIQTAKVIADCLRKYHPKYVVYDPVMLVTGGHNVPDDATIKVIKDELLLYTNLMTINLAEAEVFTGTKINTKNDVRETARILAETYRIPILLKAANLLEVNTYDILHIPDGEKWEFIGNKIVSPNIHNASLIFSAGIAAFLAYGIKLHEAVKKAREFVEIVLTLSYDAPIILERDMAGMPMPVVEMEIYHDTQ